MERRSVEAIVRALNAANVRYLIVGGLAVVAHGYVRLTVDVDLLLDLDENNLRRAVSAFQDLGYRPKVPVPLEQYCDARIRAQWVRDKGLTVFSLFSEQHSQTDIDLFVEDPLGFDQAYASAPLMEVSPGVCAPIVGLRGLMALKQQAGRAKDLLDIDYLKKLHPESSEE